MKNWVAEGVAPDSHETIGKHQKLINWVRDDKIVKFGKGYGNKVDLKSEL